MKVKYIIICLLKVKRFILTKIWSLGVFKNQVQIVKTCQVLKTLEIRYSCSSYDLLHCTVVAVIFEILKLMFL